MAFKGVFSDDFYNAIAVLPQAEQAAFTTSQVGTLLPASALAGAADCYITYSGQTVAQSQTTDSAVNIIARLQQAVATAYSGGLGGFAAGVNPPAGVPNLFNLTWTVTIVNQNLTAGALTLTAGAGVTLATNGAQSATVITFAAAVTTPIIAIYQLQVTSPTTVTMTRVA
jgi:hypothetical protein